MTTTAIIGTAGTLLLIVAAAAIVTFVVRAISRPSHRIPLPNHSNAAHTIPAPTGTSAPARRTMMKASQHTAC
jgi:hypothetical protein